MSHHDQPHPAEGRPQPLETERRHCGCRPSEVCDRCTLRLPAVLSPCARCGAEMGPYRDNCRNCTCGMDGPGSVCGHCAPTTGFVKHDAEKNRLELLPIRPLEEVGLAMTHGAKKYGAENYRKGAAWRRYVGAALRHLCAWARGEDMDAETGLSHLAHAGACILILRELQLDNLGTDDRIKGGA